MNITGNSHWYHISNQSVIDSPALIIYKDRVKQNINTAISMVAVNRLRPHVKTNKSAGAVQLLMEAGIYKFKCATIAEAEMLAMTGAVDVLMSYQPVGPKLQRFINLIKKYPDTKFSCLVDNLMPAKNIAAAALENNINIPVFIDLNIGMNRTGMDPANASELYDACNRLANIKVEGLHAYDGHIRTPDLQQRTVECNAAFEQVAALQMQLYKNGFDPTIIAGGSPTFPIHAERKEVDCSPGTFIYWDGNYQQMCKEQQFVPAALVLCRVISLPGKNKVCIDLGHKSIAAENELNKRVFFKCAGT